jgi:chromosome segregation ATPase
MSDTALLIQGVSTLVHEKENLAKENTELRAENAALRQTVETLQEDKDTLSDALRSMQGERDDAQFKLNTLQTSWNVLQDDRRRLTSEKGEVESRLSQYRETVEKLYINHANEFVPKLQEILPEGSGQALVLPTKRKKTVQLETPVNAGNVLF